MLTEIIRGFSMGRLVKNDVGNDPKRVEREAACLNEYVSNLKTASRPEQIAFQLGCLSRPYELYCNYRAAKMEEKACRERK